MNHKYMLITGEVIHGKKLGRTIGFPTANLYLGKNTGIRDGTYKLCGNILGKVYRGVGVYRENLELFEAHFFDYIGDLYGQQIHVMLRGFIRENKKFNSLEAIKKQIEQDVHYATTHNDTVLSFGTFDVLHPGHSHYLTSAKMYGDKLITIVGTDENVEKIKQKKPHYTLEQRVQNLQNLAISDMVLPGSQRDPLSWIEKYEPSVICLGYDQVGFSEKIYEYIEKKGITTQVLRIDALEPEIYKSSKMNIPGS